MTWAPGSGGEAADGQPEFVCPRGVQGDSTGPALRALAYHLRLQLLDRIQAVFADHREQAKVLRVLLHTPGPYVACQDADSVILTAPQLPGYAAALDQLVVAANAAAPHSPADPARPLRFAARRWR